VCVDHTVLPANTPHLPYTHNTECCASNTRWFVKRFCVGEKWVFHIKCLCAKKNHFSYIFKVNIGEICTTDLVILADQNASFFTIYTVCNPNYLIMKFIFSLLLWSRFTAYEYSYAVVGFWQHYFLSPSFPILLWTMYNMSTHWNEISLTKFCFIICVIFIGYCWSPTELMITEVYYK